MLQIAECQRCDLRAKSCAGACPCPKDGKNIRAHAEANYCPAKKYGDGIAPAGWNAVPVVSGTPNLDRILAERESKRGPGDAVKLVLSRLGYAIGGNCGCEAMRRKMNAWGWWGCWKHRGEIFAWFKAKGKERGAELTVAGLFAELRRAWRESLD